MLRIGPTQLDEIDRGYRRRRVERLADALHARYPQVGSRLPRAALFHYLSTVVEDGRAIGFVADADLVDCAALAMLAQSSGDPGCVPLVRRVLQDRDATPGERLDFIRRQVLPPEKDASSG